MDYTSLIITENLPEEQNNIEKGIEKSTEKCNEKNNIISDIKECSKTNTTEPKLSSSDAVDRYYYVNLISVTEPNDYETYETIKQTENIETAPPVENRNIETVKSSENRDTEYAKPPEYSNTDYLNVKNTQTKCKSFNILIAACTVLLSFGLGMLVLYLILMHKIDNNSTCVSNSTTTNSTTRECPEGFHLYKESNKCYKAIHTERFQPDQIVNCSLTAPGAHLAVILNSGENEFIANLISNSSEKENCLWKHKEGSHFYSYFLGAHTVEPNNCSRLVWQLSDDLFQEMRYTNFNDGEPNCLWGQEFCVQLAEDFKWNDISCTWESCAVCELRLT